MKRIGTGTYLLLILAVLTVTAAAQVATGTPPLSSMSGGPFDTVNLGNLNVSFAIPIMSKPGRGIPFNFALTYNSSVWNVGSSNGHSAWVLNGGGLLGWSGTQGTLTPYITYTVTTTTNPCGPSSGGPPPYSYTQSVFGSTFIYHDQWGGRHSITINQQYYSIYNSPGISNQCPPNGPQPSTSQSGATIDGSGYTLTVNPPSGSSISGSIVDRSGNNINAPMTSGSAASGGYTIQDPNGNQLTFNGTTNVFTDTTGNTVLTIGNSIPITYTYAAPGGNTTYTVNATNYGIKSNFGCSGIAEYTGAAYLVTSIGVPGAGTYTFNYENTPGSPSFYTGRITSITLPSGGQITYHYTGSNDGIDCVDGSTMAMTRTLSPGGTWAYSRTQVTGNHWQTIATTPSDPQNVGSPPPGDDTVLDFWDSISTGNFYETQRKVYQGSQSSGNLLLTSVTCWNGNMSNCTSTAVSNPITERTVTTTFPNNGQASKDDSFYTSLGLLYKVDQYGYGASGIPGPLAREAVTSYASLGNIADHPLSVTVTDGAGNTLSKTAYTYDEYSLQTPVGTTPQHVSVSTARGNATTITSTIIGSTTLSKHFHYFDTGRVYQAVDMNDVNGSATTTYNYPDANSTCGNMFPTSTTLPVSGLSTQTTWNCSGGVLKTTTDVNGNTTTTNYSDPNFWRPSSVVAPYTSNSVKTTTSFTYTPYNSSTGAFASTDSQMSVNGGASIVEQLTTINQFGQPVYSQQREGPGSSNWDSAQVLYDSFLRSYQTSMPCVYTSTAFTAQNQACPSAATTTSTFDALGRPTKTTDGGGGYVQYTYTQNDVETQVGPVVSGENLKTKQLEYDALGRLTSVCEVTNLNGYVQCGQTNALNGYFTTYSFGVNASGYPTTTVTQGPSGSQQTRVYTYDLLGRVISEQNPENATTTYTYDSDSSGVCSGTYTGDLVKVVDAKGNKICYQYDALHRVTSITYPSSGPDAANTPSKTFVFDSATFNSTAMSNPKGRLVEAYTGSVGSKTTDVFFSYSVRGEVTDTWECTPHSGTNGCASVSNYYHVSAGFWENGALKTLSSSISGVPAQTYAVDSMGRTSAVSASSGQNPVTGMNYNLSAFTTSVTFGSGDSDTFYLDSATGRQTKYVFNMNGVTNTGQTTWNANGSLQSFNITDNIPTTSDTQNCSFSHDDLARVSSVNCVNGSTNLWNQQFTYDRFGNITKNSSGPGGVFQPTYGSSSNWITALPGCTPTTDANGQMTYDCTHNYTWDAEHKMHSVDASPASCSSSGECMTYDALGRMVEKLSGSTYFDIVYGPQGRFATMNGQTLLKAFIPLPTGATAVYTSSGLAYYRHTDHLGSARLATTPTRTLWASASYAPYGETYSSVGTADFAFAGQERYTVTGMMDTLFRKYSTAQGRWLSPDPAGLVAVDPGNPQSWNRYAYALNNPMTLIDPMGDDAYEGCSSATPYCYTNLFSNPIYFGQAADPFSFIGIPLLSPGAIFVDGGCLGCIDSFFGNLAQTPDFSTFSTFNPPLPKKGFCSFTANGGNLPHASRDAIQAIFNQAGVGIDFEDGPGEDLSVANVNLPRGTYGIDTFGTLAQVDMSKFTRYPSAAGVIISHEWGHWILDCSHLSSSPFAGPINSSDCGYSGLMGPGMSFFHGRPSPLMNPGNPQFEFRPEQFQAIQDKCRNQHP